MSMASNHSRQVAIDVRSFPPRGHPLCSASGVECGCSRQHARCLILVMLTQPYVTFFVNWLHGIRKINPDADIRAVSYDQESCQWLRSTGLEPGRSHVLKPKDQTQMTNANATTTLSVECSDGSCCVSMSVAASTQKHSPVSVSTKKTAGS